MFSLIITVKNEKDNLADWIAGIKAQSVFPDEIIIVDGGSSDGTLEYLQSIKEDKINIFKYLGNIAEGRNFAIKQAKGEYIVVADAGCIYEIDWFKKIKEKLESDHDFVCTGFKPWFKADDKLLIYLIAVATMPTKKELEKNDWYPSSRSVAFTKKLWGRAGGYPEWIPICEDVLFDLKMMQLTKLERIKSPLVFWRPRKSLKTYFKQLYKYTKSDGHGKLHLNRNLLRYFVYLFSIVLLILSFKISFFFILLLCFGGVVYVKKFWIRWFEFTKKKKKLYKVLGILFVPFIIIFGDIAKMSGWPVGVWERCQKKKKFEN